MTHLSVLTFRAKPYCTAESAFPLSSYIALCLTASSPSIQRCFFSLQLQVLHCTDSDNIMLIYNLGTVNSFFVIIENQIERL